MWGSRHDHVRHPGLTSSFDNINENTDHENTNENNPSSDRNSDGDTIQMMDSPTRRSSFPSSWQKSTTIFKMPRLGIDLAASILAGTLLVNLLLATIALLSYARFHSKGSGGATVYVGSCGAVEGWNSALHLLGNALASLAVAACVYALQWVTAPSRAEIDRAHVRRCWRVIGSLGWRNLGRLSRRRWLLVLGVVSAAVPFHMMVNSAVYSSKTLKQFDAFVASAHAEVNEQLVDSMGPDRCLGRLLGWNKAGFNAALKNGQFERLDAETCRRQFENPLSDCKFCGAGQGTMVLLSSELKNSSLFYASGESLPDTGSWMADLVPLQIPEWNVTVPIRNGTFTMNPHLLNGIPMDVDVEMRKDLATMYDFLLNNYTESVVPYTGLERFQKFLREAHWNNATWAQRAVIQQQGLVCTPEKAFDTLTTPYLLNSPQYKVDGCLNQKITEDCELTILPAGLLLVLAFSVIQVACVFLIARHDKPGALLTVGDAIASFMANPDPSTTGQCMMSKSTVGRAWEAPWLPWLFRQRAPPRRDPTVSYPEALPQGQRWFQAASLYQWGVAVLLALAYLGLLGFVLIGYLPRHASFWELSGKKALASNTPHLALSLLYFFYDDLFTCMAIVDEYSQYALQRMPLRVSHPRGIQRSTYYLSLPYKYAVPLLLMTTVLHWTLSKTFFFTQFIIYDKFGDVRVDSPISTFVFAGRPAILTLVLSLVTVCLALGLGARRLPISIPLASNCSAAISAACHPPRGDPDAALRPVMWGEFDEPASDIDVENDPVAADDRDWDGKAGYARCGFSSAEVATPSGIRLYA